MEVIGRGFGIVVCHQGLQFFPNRAAALHEMHRVLIPGGRLALASWCEIESSPGHYALAQALEKHVGSDAAALMYGVFCLEVKTIETMMDDAGLRDVDVHRERKMVRFSSAESFARLVVAGSVLGRTGVKVSKEAMTALLQDVEETLQPYVDPDGLAFSVSEERLDA